MNMPKKYSQSKKAKEQFKSKVFDYMMNDPQKVYDKDELASHFQVDERTIRAHLEKIANYYPVVAFSNRIGYQIVVWSKEMTIGELESCEEDILHQIAELNSRIKNLKARLKPLVANKVMLKKVINEKYAEDVLKDDSNEFADISDR